MNIVSLSCKILSLVLLWRLHTVACDHSGSALHRSHNKSNYVEEDVNYHTKRGKKYTKKLKNTPDKVSRSSDDGPPDQPSRLFILDVSNRNDTEFTKYKYKNDHHIFITKKPFLVMAIRRGFTFLWHPKENKYPNVVVLYPKEKETRKLKVFYPGENSGFTDPDDEPKTEKQQLRGFVGHSKQKNHYSVQTITVDRSKPRLKTKKVAHHEPEGSVESEPEPATDVEILLAYEPKPQELLQTQIQPQPEKLPQPVTLIQPREPLPPPAQPQLQIPIVPIPSLQVVQPQEQAPSTPKPVQNKLVHLNIKDKRSTNILIYGWDHKDKADVFTLKYPYLFDMVLMDQELLWNFEGNYPYEVKVFHLENGNLRIRAFFPFDKNEPTTQESPLPQQPAVLPLQQVPQVPQQAPLPPPQLPTPPQPQEVPQLHQETPHLPKSILEDYAHLAQQSEQVAQPSEQVVQPSEQVTQPAPKAPETPEKSPEKKPSNLVKLDIKEKWTDDYVEYIWDDTLNADVFIANPPYLLGAIVDGTEILWKKMDGRYPYAVAVINPETDKTLVRTYFSEPEYQPQAQQVAEKPKNAENDQLNNNVQALN